MDVTPVVWTRLPRGPVGPLIALWLVLWALAYLAGCTLERSGVFTPDPCVPASCQELAIECGPVDDGCGGFLDCGGCGGRSQCANNECECHPLECGEPGLECGEADDGCGGQLACGDTCEQPEMCGATAPNVCGCPDACETSGRPECGLVWDDCNAEAIPCGRPCPPSATCVESACAELTHYDVLINEFSWEFDYAELLGPPNLDLGDLHLIAIEGDRNTDQGRIRFAHPLGTLDDDGYLTIELDDDFVGTGTVTLLLVRDYYGATDGSTDVDTNGNGIFNFQPWSEIIDGVAIDDGAVDARTYSELAVLSRNFDGFGAHVGGASRVPNGVDTDTDGDWARNDPGGFGMVPGAAPAPGLAAHTPAALRGPGYNVVIKWPPTHAGDRRSE